MFRPAAWAWARGGLPWWLAFELRSRDEWFPTKSGVGGLAGGEEQGWLVRGEVRGVNSSFEKGRSEELEGRSRARK